MEAKGLKEQWSSLWHKESKIDKGMEMLRIANKHTWLLVPGILNYLMLYVKRRAFLAANIYAGVLLQGYPWGMVLKAPYLRWLKCSYLWKFVNNQRVVYIYVKTLLLFFGEDLFGHALAVLGIICCFKVWLVNLKVVYKGLNFGREIMNSLISILLNVIWSFFC